MLEKYEKTRPLLSAIMPLKGPVEDIEFLKSLLVKARSLNIELIVVHDLQDKMTQQVLKEIFNEPYTSGCKLFEAELNSPGLSRNIGLQKSTGEWVTFWDSDDQPDPTKFIEMVRIGNENFSEIVIGNFSVLINESKEIYAPRVLISKMLEIVLQPGLWRMIFRSELAKEATFIKSRMGEDQAYLVDLQLFQRKISWFEMVVYKYKVGGENQLTFGYKNVGYLRDTVEYLFEKNKNSAKSLHMYGILVIYKLLLTGIIRGSWRMKLQFIGFSIIGIPYLVTRFANVNFRR